MEMLAMITASMLMEMLAKYGNVSYVEVNVSMLIEMLTCSSSSSQKIP